jgi:hypothetical protein
MLHHPPVIVTLISRGLNLVVQALLYGQIPSSLDARVLHASALHARALHARALHAGGDMTE